MQQGPGTRRPVGWIARTAAALVGGLILLGGVASLLGFLGAAGTGPAAPPSVRLVPVTVAPTRPPVPATASPVPPPAGATETGPVGRVRYIANTEGMGVKVRTTCDDQTGAPGWPDGARVTVIDARADCPEWLLVERSEGDESWVRVAYLSEAPPRAAAAWVPPTVTPAPQPTATPRPSGQPIELTGVFSPPTVRVGERVVFELTLVNLSDRPIEGLRIFSTGPWEKFTLIDVGPGGLRQPGPLGWDFYSGLALAPGRSGQVRIVASPNEPGHHRFVFIPNRLDTRQFVGDDGQQIAIGGDVAASP